MCKYHICERCCEATWLNGFFDAGQEDGRPAGSFVRQHHTGAKPGVAVGAPDLQQAAYGTARTETAPVATFGAAHTFDEELEEARLTPLPDPDFEIPESLSNVNIILVDMNGTVLGRLLAGRLVISRCQPESRYPVWPIPP